MGFHSEIPRRGGLNAVRYRKAQKSAEDTQVCKGARHGAKERLHANIVPARPKLLQKILFKNNCFGTINFVKVTKQSLYKANSFACSLASRDKPVAATLQRKCSGGILSVIITKIITKIIVPRNYFVILSARMVNTQCVTPCAAKTCAVRPVFGRVVGKLGAADPKFTRRAMKANARPRARSEAFG